MALFQMWVDRWVEPAWMVTWLLAVLAALVALVVRARRLRSAAVRHALWWFALLAPLVIVPARLGLTRARALVPLPVPAVAFEVATGAVPEPMADAAPPRIPGSAPAPAASPWRPALGATDVLALLWLLGVAAFVTRLLVSHRRACRVLRASSPLAQEEWRAIFSSLCAEAGLRRPAALHRSDAICAPALYGWQRPVVLLPESLLGLDREQARALLAHEVAHLRRRDFAANLLQRVVGAVLFFHPAAWLASRQISLSREECCDAWALSRGIPAAIYARSLAEAVARAHLRPALALITLAEEKSSLRRRVEAVLRGAAGPRPTRRMVFMLACTVLIITAAGAVVRLAVCAPGGEEASPARRARRHRPAAQAQLAQALSMYASGPAGRVAAPPPSAPNPVAASAQGYSGLDAQEADAALQAAGVKVVKLAYRLPVEHYVSVEVERYQDGKLVQRDLPQQEPVRTIAGDHSLLFFPRERDHTLALSYVLLEPHHAGPQICGRGSAPPISLEDYYSSQVGTGSIPDYRKSLEDGKRTLFWYWMSDRAGRNARDWRPPFSAASVPAVVAKHDLVIVAYATVTRFPEPSRNWGVPKTIPVTEAYPPLHDPSLAPEERLLTEGAGRLGRITYSLPVKHRISVELVRYEHGALKQTYPAVVTEGVAPGPHSFVIVDRSVPNTRRSTLTYAVLGKEGVHIASLGEYAAPEGFTEGPGHSIPLTAVELGKKTPFGFVEYQAAAPRAAVPAPSIGNLSGMIARSDWLLVAYLTVTPM